MDTNLVPIGQIIKEAKSAGATFGHGDPRTHLAYLTKLRLLPQTVRRRIGGAIVGCYPSSAVSTILSIEQLKADGLTYPQIRQELGLSSQNAFRSPAFLPAVPSNLSFLIIGLLLGFLLAGRQSAPAPATAAVPAAKAVQTAATPLSRSTVLFTSNPSESADGTIYILAVPKQNLDNLGKFNINYLNSASN